jgi:hypothetical protein
MLQQLASSGCLRYCHLLQQLQFLVQQLLQ